MFLGNWIKPVFLPRLVNVKTVSLLHLATSATTLPLQPLCKEMRMYVRTYVHVCGLPPGSELQYCACKICPTHFLTCTAVVLGMLKIGNTIYYMERSQNRASHSPEF